MALLSNLGGLGTSGTGSSSVDATGVTVGTISNAGTVGVAPGSTLNWTAGQTATNAGAWGIGSVNNPLGGGVLNLGEAAGAPVGATQTYSGAFTNVGTVNVNSGTNVITGAFTNNGSLLFATGTNSYNGAYSEAQIGFAPNITFASGTNSFNSTVAVPSIWSLSVNGGVNNFDLSTSITGLVLSGGTLTGLGSITVPTGGGFNWTNGTLATTGVGANAATLTLSAGSTTTLGQAASTLNLNRALTNGGTVSIQNVNAGWATALNIGAGGSFTNNGTFNLGNAVAGAVTVNVSDTGTFTNGAAGIINSAGAVTNAIQATLGTTVGTVINNGAINVAAGNTLNHLGGQAAASTGTFTTASGGTLNLGAGTGATAGAVSYSGTITNNGTLDVSGVTLNSPLVNNGSATFTFSSGGYTAAYSGTGALTLSIAGGAYSFAPTLAALYVIPSLTYMNLGNLNFDVNATILNLNLQGSGFRGNGAITIAPGGTLTVNGTTLGGFSALNVSAGATANFSNAAIYRPVTNLGTMNVSGFSTISTVPSAAGSNNGSLTNGATGVLNLNGGFLQPRNGGFFTNNAGGQVIALTGFNTIDATGLSFTPTLVGTITNNGSITVNTGASLAITNGFSSTNSGTYTNAAGGTLDFNTATGATGQTYTYTGSLINNGTMNFLGAGNAITTGTLTQTGLLNVATGVTLAAPSFTNTGTLSGAGTFNLGTGTITNNGIIAPGGVGTLGTLSITGNLVMGATGALNIDINSPVTGQYDELIVSGTATLTGGTLNLIGSAAGSYDVLNATGGLGGTKFAAINSVSIYPQTSTYTANILTVAFGKSGMRENVLSELVKETLISPREADGKRRGPRLASNDSGRAAPRGVVPKTVCQ